MGRQETSESLWRHFGSQPFRVKDAETAGIPRYAIYRLRDQGVIEELARGIYRLHGGDLGAAIDLATVSARVPHGTICLNSALAFWDLTDEIPSAVHLAVPRGTHPPRIDYPPTRAHVFAPETFDLGRKRVVADSGEGFWIYSRERSVVDAMRMAHLIGRDQALHALRRYLAAPNARPGELSELAQRLHAGPSVHDAMEVLLS
jgi:predicted transcriptional regulator of viral defense system